MAICPGIRRLRDNRGKGRQFVFGGSESSVQVARLLVRSWCVRQCPPPEQTVPGTGRWPSSQPVLRAVTKACSGPALCA